MSELFFIDRDVSARRGDFEIVLIIDRSGSMSYGKEDTIEGLNKFLREQKELDESAKITIAQFDDQYELLFDAVDIQEVPYFTEATFVPRGGTALLDAIGRTLSVLDGRIAGTEEGKMPRKVAVAIVTDGQENQSMEFKLDTIKENISTREKTGWWEFHFIGADMDAIGTGRDLGLNATRVMSVNKSDFGGKGMSAGLMGMSTSYTISRTTADPTEE